MTMVAVGVSGPEAAKTKGEENAVIRPRCNVSCFDSVLLFIAVVALVIYIGFAIHNMMKA